MNSMEKLGELAVLAWVTINVSVVLYLLWKDLGRATPMAKPFGALRNLPALPTIPGDLASHATGLPIYATGLHHDADAQEWESSDFGSEIDSEDSHDGLHSSSEHDFGISEQDVFSHDDVAPTEPMHGSLEPLGITMMDSDPATASVLINAP